jgi:hypothetical protein
VNEMNEPDRQYNGEFRYVNLGPAQVCRRLESEQDPAERASLMTALEFWRRKSPEREVVAGQPFSDEPRRVVHAGSMRELAGKVKPVEHVFVRGALDDNGALAGASGESVIDWDMLGDR